MEVVAVVVAGVIPLVATAGCDVLSVVKQHYMVSPLSTEAGCVGAPMRR